MAVLTFLSGSVGFRLAPALILLSVFPVVFLPLEPEHRSERNSLWKSQDLLWRTAVHAGTALKEEIF